MIMQYNYKINKKMFLLIFLINLKIKVKKKLKPKNNQNLISKFKIVMINQTKLFNKVKYKKEREKRNLHLKHNQN